jgi:CRISPR-associated protein Csb2
MLAVTVEFLHRTIRCAGSDDTAITGQGGGHEWPPAPMRLYSAFVAADGTGPRARLTGGAIGLDLLEGEPVIHAEPVVDTHANTGSADDPRRGRGPRQRGVLVNTIEPRFVVSDRNDGAGTQNYPGRANVVARPGVRLALCDPRVAYVWPDTTPTAAELRALRLRAARVGYLGCADSPVRVRVHTTGPDLDDLPVWQPAPDDGDTVVSVAYPGVLDALDESFQAWTRGEPRRRAWIPTRLTRYRSPTQPTPTPGALEGVWLRFDRPIAGRFVVAVAEALRGAVLGQVEDLVGSPDKVPAVLHGHLESPGSEHVRWLPLPHIGGAHPDGRIRGACIWLPPGTDAKTVELTHHAASQVVELAGARSGRNRPGVFPVTKVSVFDGTTRPWSTTPTRWQGPATRWVTAFPAIHERFKAPPTVTEVGRWCAHAGLPAPIAVHAARVPLVQGGVDIPPPLTCRKGEQVRPYSHLEITFAEAVTGPIAIGRGRHWGLGLLAPAPDTQEGRRAG